MLCVHSAVSDEMLLHATGMKWKNTSYHKKINGASAIFYRCNTLSYVYPLFKTHKLTPESLFDVVINCIPVRSLQPAGNIGTSRIIAVYNIYLK